jgi:hypothetical protein
VEEVLSWKLHCFEMSEPRTETLEEILIGWAKNDNQVFSRWKDILTSQSITNLQLLTSLSEADWKNLFNEVVNREESQLLFHLQVFHTKRNSERIDVESFLKTLPNAMLYEREQGSESAAVHANSVTPEAVQEWEDFASLVSSYTPQFTTLFVSKPNLSDPVQVAQESQVQAHFANQVCNPFDRFFEDTNLHLKFGSHQMAKICIGEPDFILRSLEDSSLIFFIEMKTKWSLDDLILDGRSLHMYWIQNANLRNVVGQVMGYLTANGLEYGALSSFDLNWFLKREGFTLLISRPVPYFSNSPFLYRCIAYMVSLCLHFSSDDDNIDDEDEDRKHGYEEIDEDDVHDDGDSSSSPDVDDSREPAQKKQKTVHTIGDTSKDTDDTIPNDFHLGLLRERIGFGFCGAVYRSNYKGLDLAVKLCDVFNNKKGVELMKKEVSLYKLLSSLQGSSIPQLYFYGQRWGLYIIATGYISGVHPKLSGLSEKVIKEQLDERMKDILAFGVSHGDIRDENMIVTPNGKLVLLDFSHSLIKND